MRLNWQEGHPTEPGKYLFRFAKGLDLENIELMLALTKPTGYNWFIVDVYLDKNGWLVYKDEEGIERVAFGDGYNIHIWFAKVE